MSTKAQVLHIGCGRQSFGGVAAKVFNPANYQEVRVDIDVSVKPDIVASMTNLSMISNESVDGIYSSHNLEHLYPHEVSIAAREFFRILSTKGVVLITLPDIEQVARSIIEVGLENPLFQAGPNSIAALDILYGFRPAMARGNSYMAHRMGFTSNTLANYFVQAGFRQVEVQPDGAWNLWAIAYKNKPDQHFQLALRRTVFTAQRQTVVYVPG